MSSTTLLSLGALALSTSIAPVGATSYQLVQNYAGQSFLDGFNFYTNSDPTHGFVQYVDQATAENNSLVSVTSSGSIYLGVDHKTTLSEADIGRQSVRVQSDYMFDQGLVIADIKHMPAGSCGVWPAFWTVGNTWPGDGEIDIIEGVNFQTVNQMVLHTAGQCSISSADQTGTTANTDCSTKAGTQGCSVTGSSGSFGTGFNTVEGGVYAMEWTSQAIKIWFWPRNTIPASIQSGHPDVSQFGKPMGNFQGSCDVASVFHNQRLIFDTTFCGDWAGALFGKSGCTMKYPNNALQSCINYVANHPGDYQDAYWEINYVKVFEAGTSTTTTTTATSTTVTSSTGISTTSFSTTLSSSSTSASSTSAATNTSPSAPPTQGSGPIGTAARTVPVPSVTSTTAVAPYPLSNCSSTVASTKTVFVTGSPSLPSSAPGPKETVTTVVVTSYVDICPTGFTTKTTTQTVTYCPADQTTSGIAPGFTTTTKVCTACAATPTTVTLTVPVTPTATAATTVTVATGAPATIPAGSPATVPAGARATIPAGAPVISSPSPATSAVAATSPSAPYPTTNGISSAGAAAPTGLPASPSVSGSGSSGSSGSGSSQPGNGSSPGSPSSSAVGPTFTGAASKLSSGTSSTLFRALMSAALALSLLI